MAITTLTPNLFLEISSIIADPQKETANRLITKVALAAILAFAIDQISNTNFYSGIIIITILSILNEPMFNCAIGMLATRDACSHISMSLHSLYSGYGIPLELVFFAVLSIATAWSFFDGADG